MAAKKGKPAGKAAAPPRVEVRTPSSDFVTTVEKPKYDAMRKALFKVLPRKPPGLTQNEMFAQVVRHLPRDLFPGGAKAPWWVKCVQLDLESRGGLAREATKPLRWHRP